MSKLSIEDYLEQNGELTYRNVGVSMMPLLKQDRDLFTVIRKTDKRCSKNDVVLYKRSPNTYVLHRVIKVRKNDYVLRGDNCLNTECGVTDDDILGIMTSFVHRGKKVNVTDWRYRCYIILLQVTTPVRIPIKKSMGTIKHELRKNKAIMMAVRTIRNLHVS